MSKVQLNPYFSFNGNARQAMQFYETVFGGELNLSTYGESPMDAPENHKDKIMHASLITPDGFVIMAADNPPGQTSTIGGNVGLSMVDKDADLLTKYFNSLAEGGEITLKLEKQFWGDVFGMVKDKFGTMWLVNVDARK